MYMQINELYGSYITMPNMFLSKFMLRYVWYYFINLDRMKKMVNAFKPSSPA